MFVELSLVIADGENMKEIKEATLMELDDKSFTC